jgi:pyruvate kinase
VATIGPASWSPRLLEGLIRAGIDVARLNMSQGTQAGHRQVIERLRRAESRSGRPLAILVDLAGPKIRSGLLAGGRPIRLAAGAAIVLTPRPVPGGPEEVSVSYRGLAREVAPGARILLDDGKLELRVRRVRGRDVVCEVMVGGLLAERKGVNLPDTGGRLAAFTAKDRADLRFALASGVDFIAMSFVRRPADVKAVKREMGRVGSELPVIAKIEKPQAIEQIDEILDMADGVMVARGDLGVEMSTEEVPIMQKRIIRRANQAQVPVIVATQMLESMTENPRPTRAEASDVANAILDGTDAVMLSGETAIGRYPVAAVRTMARIAERAEESQFAGGGQGVGGDGTGAAVLHPSAGHAIAQAAVSIAREVAASAIAVFTLSGTTANLVAKARPPMPVIALTPDPATLRRLSLYWGVTPLATSMGATTNAMIMSGVAAIRRARLVRRGVQLVIVAGTTSLRGGSDIIHVSRLD